MTRQRYSRNPQVWPRTAFFLSARAWDNYRGSFAPLWPLGNMHDGLASNRVLWVMQRLRLVRKWSGRWVTVASTSWCEPDNWMWEL